MEVTPSPVLTQPAMAKMANAIAFIVAIEDYRFGGETGINSVAYARNDATKFKKLLKEEFAIPEENITMWLDKDANKSAFENELKYALSQLTKGDSVIFYYAGHGFYQDQHNKLTCWDTHPSSLNETTVSLNHVLLEPLAKSACEQALIFLDCCATNLSSSLSGRDFMASLDPRKLENFIRQDKYNALFMSCSPGEKSYPSAILKHGIWTWHLIEALKGNVKDILVQDKYITDTALKNYLSYVVPKFITENTAFRDTQRPYAKISASNEFLIRELPEVEEELNHETPKLRLDFSNVSFRKITSAAIKRGRGFKKNHFAPEVFNSSSNAFAQKVFEEEVAEEIQAIYSNSKDILSLKRRDLATAAESGSGSVDCYAFRYSIETEQNPDNFGEALITRKLVVRIKRTELPENFDDIFPHQINEVIIPVIGTLDFDTLVDQFENLEETEGGKLTENQMTGEITYKTTNGLSLSIDIEEKILVLYPNKTMKYLQLVDISAEGLKRITASPIRLLD